MFNFLFTVLVLFVLFLVAAGISKLVDLMYRDNEKGGWK